MKATALIADIVKSKNIKERIHFQEKLHGFFEKLSANSPYLLSPYTITLGDEFQAVYSHPGSVIHDAFTIISELYPVRIRFAFGCGEIITNINRKESIGMDGSAFYNARKGIDDLKKTGYSIIRFCGCSGNDYELINSSLSATMAVMGSWKKNTVAVFTELLKQRQVKDIIKDVDITQRAVYKIIETHKLREMVELYSKMADSISTVSE